MFCTVCAYNKEWRCIMAKSFDDLTIADDFMFCKVMQNMNICKKVLELVLEEDLSIKKSHHNKQ